jgi:hypothetical protein
MFELNFQGLIGDQLDTLKPHARRFANHAGAYADAVVCRLDRAIDLLDDISGDKTSTRYWYIDSATVGQRNVKPIFTVPANEVWELETVLIWAPSGGVMSHELWDGANNIAGVGFPTAASAGTDPMPLWGQMSAQAGANVYSGAGTRFKPSTDVYYSIRAGAATGQTGAIRVQVKRIKDKDRNQLRPFVGFKVADHPRDTVEDTETGRHTGTWVQGPVR